MYQKNDRYRLLIENIPDAFAYHRVITDDQGNPVDYEFLEVNEAFEEMTGLAKGKVVGKKAAEVQPAIEDSSFDWIGTYGKVALTGESTRFKQFFKPADQWYEFTAYSDTPGFFAVVFRNISEFKKQEAELRLERDLNFSILNDIPTFLVIIDSKGRLLKINDVMLRATGYKLNEVIGTDYFHTFIPPSDQEKLSRIFETLVERHEPTVNESYILTKDGRKLLVEWHGMPVKQPGGTVDYFYVLGIDITKRKKAEQKLQESETKYRLLVESSYDAITIMNKEGRFTDCNQRAIEVFGVQNMDDFVSFTPVDFSPDFQPDGRSSEQAAFEYINQAVERGFSRFEWSHQRRNGESFPAEIILITYQAGDEIFIQATVRDIAERRRAEQELKAQQRLLEGVINGVSDVLFIQHPDHSIERYNQAGYELLGMTPEEVKGKKCYELIGRDRECEQCTTSIALKTGKLEKKQQYFPNLGVYLDCRSNPVLDSKGSVVQIVGQLRDITKQKEQEKLLRESEEKYRALFNQSGVGIYLHDLTGQILDVNQEACLQLGYSRDELLKQKIFDLHPNHANTVNLAKDQILSKWNQWKPRQRVTLEGEHQHKDGTLVPVQISTGLVHYEDQKLILAIAQDITERKQAEEKIRYMSFHDSLTGLYNRYYLEEEMKRLDTQRQLPISIIMTDVNGLKLVNDTYGHSTGDKVLIQAAQILKRFCREDDIIARWGGDEFVVILPRTNKKDAWAICKRINNECCKDYVKGVPVSMATGVSSKDRIDKDLARVLKEAEDHMYRHKLTESRSVRSAVLNSLLKTLREKSYETEAHTRSMQEIALKIGEKIDLPDSELSRLRLLITLHDIGKINIPGEVLTKKGPLTQDEWKVIKKHPETGCRIARATDEFVHVAEDILAHHERWDGTGYPQGLKEKEIPLLARVTAVADAYEVMSNGRPYKKAMFPEEVVAEIKKCAGTQFDPELVEVFVSVLEV